MKKLLIIGGSDAGIMAALRAREVDPSLDVIVATRDAYPNFSICGLPFWLGGEVAEWQNLAHRTKADIEGTGIKVHINHEALAIEPEQHFVAFEDEQRRHTRIEYDKLILGTGGISRKPPIAGLDLPGVFFLRWIQDGLALQDFLEKNSPNSIALIGGGYIGMEMADAMLRRGLDVILLEHAHSLLPNIDPELSGLVEKILISHGVKVHTGFTAAQISWKSDQLHVISSQGDGIAVDAIVVAAGARPNTELAHTAGIEIGGSNAVKVTRHMETNIPDIYAAGDCVETWHRQLGRYTYMPLGSVAHKQGWIAGENAAGGKREYTGTLGTQAVKIFDQVVARTGLLEKEAKTAGFKAVTTSLETWDHKIYYPEARNLHIRITGDVGSRKLLGAQILGPLPAEISKRIDVVATALYHGMTVDDLEDLDLSYTPPLSSPWDPVQMAARKWAESFKR
jgi:NADPH-dependent 2,4-dienoyl-CoA reductase/sulfur reductase-like enzyme